MAQSATDARARWARTAERPRLRTRALGQAAWALAAVVALVLLVAGAPARFASLDTVPAEGARIAQQLHPWEADLFRASGLGVGFYAFATTALDVFATLAWLVVSAVIFWRRSTDRAALLVALALALFAATMSGFPDALVSQDPTWGFVLRGLNVIGAVFLTAFFFVFPDGRFVPAWTRWVLLVGVLLYGLLYLLPGPDLDPHVSYMGGFAVVLLNGLGVGAQIYRYRRIAGSVERQQIRWVIVGMGALVGGLILVMLVSWAASVLARSSPALYILLYLVGYGTFTACKLTIPAALTLAIMRYRLWDVDLVLNRALVYAALTASAVGLYALVVGGLGALLEASGSAVLSLVAAALVAVLLQPLRERLQRAVNRLMYGERDDPYAVLSRLGQRLESTLSPEAVLPTIVQTVAQTLKLPYAAVALHADGHSAPAACFDSPVQDPLIVPLVHQGQTVGQLILGGRPGESSFSPSDHRLLNDLARQTGIAAHAVRLTAELQRSRERLVTTREEERRRLRRDLHDGMGPGLAAMAMQSEAARDLVRRDPEQADALLADLTEQLQAATADIRRLVYELRPPALDDLGLVGAVRSQISRFERGRVRIRLEAAEPLPVLPAAVEVASYRIILEALNNVARHAQAETCCVRVAVDETADRLCVDIQDDGRGLAPGRQTGVGLASMRERAAELGGTCVVEPGETGGTRVFAALPITLAGQPESGPDQTAP